MLGGGRGSGSTYLVDVVEEEDVVSDGGLYQEHCLLFFDGRGKAVSGCGEIKT